ncbi:hypothetical protein [Dactylosporangium sp. NPDC051541]|uniref:hypothetical protein n=1 Tax=Dactylosporangium sp. NPDC051541 TaxID=3363977 RepID=UPI003797A8F4
MGIASRITKRTAVIGTVSAVALAGGIAYAAWTITGSGSAGASASTAQPVSFSNTTVGTLYPGATVDVRATASNPNPFPVNYTAPATPAITVTGGTGTCASTNVIFTAGGAVGIGPASGSTPGTANNAAFGTLKMINDAADGCQGATFTVDLAGGTGVSAA